MPLFEFRRRSTRRRWVFIGTGTTLVAALLLIVAAATANLAGSPFDAGDGNLVLNDETQDWVNAPNFAKALDLPTGQNDNSFGQGTKEDTAVPTVVTGSIPNNKSDLTRFYVANEKVSTKQFLYLAWERVQEPTGTTNMDFEFNQSSTLSSNGVTPVRTAGDVLIKYDLSQGGTNPTLGYHLWVTSGNPATVCEANNSLPCWGKVQSLSGNFEGSINTVAVTDPIAPNAPRQLSVRTFGEAAINLTDSGILPPGTCRSFGSAYLKSRSSDSFTAAVKDFIAPIPVSISNCGQIIIRKVTSPSPDPTDSSFSYTTTGGLSPSSFSLKDGGSRDYGDSVQAGSYSVTESDPGPNFVLSGIDCSASDLSHGSSATPNQATGAISIDLKAEDTIDCTYTNTLQQGAIAVHKTDSKTGADLAGAQFSIAGQTVTTDDSGVACVGGLVFGSYDVQETAAPPGYNIDDDTVHHVTVDSVGTCASGAEGPVAFSDTPTSDIQVNFKDGGSGVTSGSISCDNGTGTSDTTAASGWDTSLTVTGVEAPTTIHCTIVIDP